jgi:hypothetical protein
MTTAAVLGAFRRELIAEGFSAEIAEEIARSSAVDLTADGQICVRDSTDAESSQS